MPMLRDEEVTLSTITIIVPTLNEVANIDPLLKRILVIRNCCNLDFDILFVDSASTDGTGERILTWQEKEPVRLLQHETTMGLAEAVVAGARNTESEYVLVMDADLSHPPECIPQLLQPLLNGTHDIVIGSRYIAGGAVPDWPWSRKLCSKIATIPALMFCQAKDPLAGFFATRRVRLTGLSDAVPGFKIALAVLAEYGRDLRIAEIPIEFRDRDYGVSKMNYRVAFSYLKQLLCLTGKKIGLGPRNTGRMR